MSHRRRQLYFVCRLGDDDPCAAEGTTYEVQLLDSQLRGEKAGLLRESDDELSIDGSGVPRAVIDAAKRRRPGHGEYVDAEGRPFSPFS